VISAVATQGDNSKTSSTGVHTKKMSMENPSSALPLQGNDNDNVDDISKYFLSLTINPSKRHEATANKLNEWDFSTTLSADSLSDCCLIEDDDLLDDDVPTKDHVCERGFGCTVAAHSSGEDKAGSFTVQCDVVDLCNSP